MKTRTFSFVLALSSVLSISHTAQANNWALGEKGLNVYKAWTLEKGSENIVIGVVDTGVDFDHKDLKEKAWINPGESGPWTPKNKKEFNKAPLCADKSCNGIDDDGDGFVDNVNGYDFPLEKNAGRDVHGHGTHIAGIIAGTINLDKGVGGVAPKVKIASYRYFPTDSSGRVPAEESAKNFNARNLTSDWNIKALELAVKNKVNIINYSGGGKEAMEQERKILEKARDLGILVVVAAGNESEDFKENGNTYYPCSYALENIICVGNLTQADEIAPSSNKGKKYIDVFAPGTHIYSTTPNNGYSYMTGTSQSTAFISGIAGLIWSRHPTLSSKEVKDIILKATEEIIEEPKARKGKVAANEPAPAPKIIPVKLESLKDQSKTEGKIDAYLALKKADEYVAFKLKMLENANTKTLQAEATRDKSSKKYSRGVSATSNSSKEKGH